MDVPDKPDVPTSKRDAEIAVAKHELEKVADKLPNPFSDGDKVQVVITIEEAHDLPTKEPDAYVKITCEATGEHHKTYAKSNTNDPEWNEDYSFEFKSTKQIYESTFTLDVFDKNMGTDTHLCTRTLDLAHLFLGKRHWPGHNKSKTLDMHSCQDGKKGGKLTLKLRHVNGEDPVVPGGMLFLSMELLGGGEAMPFEVQWDAGETNFSGGVVDSSGKAAGDENKPAHSGFGVSLPSLSGAISDVSARCNSCLLARWCMTATPFVLGLIGLIFGPTVRNSKCVRRSSIRSKTTTRCRCLSRSKTLSACPATRTRHRRTRTLKSDAPRPDRSTRRTPRKTRTPRSGMRLTASTSSRWSRCTAAH